MRNSPDIICDLRFVGSMTRKIGFVRVYSRTLKWLFAISVVFGIAAIVTAFLADRHTFICTNPDIKQNCEQMSRYFSGFVILIVIVVNWIVHLCESLSPSYFLYAFSPTFSGLKVRWCRYLLICFFAL